jgi:hypothetical protein
MGTIKSNIRTAAINHVRDYLLDLAWDYSSSAIMTIVDAIFKMVSF